MIRAKLLFTTICLAAFSISGAAQDGSLDLNFNPTDPGNGLGDGATGWLMVSALQPDGKILIGGDFVRYNNTIRQRIARVLADGSLDPSFDPGSGASSTVATIAIQADGKLLIGGYFTSYNGTTCNYICRLDANGALDPSFIQGTGASGVVHTCVVQPDGKILIGGSFSNYNGTARNRIARLNSDGSLDMSFAPGSGASYTVRTCVLQPDGKILIGGDLTSYNGTSRNRIARLNADGSLDTGFDPGTGANSFVYGCSIQLDGKILISGDFTTYNGIARNRITRLNSDGSLDAGFDPGIGANSTVYTCLSRPDGKIVIGGNFTAYDGQVRNYAAGLNSDGSLDSGFNTIIGADNAVRSCVLQPDGKILAGGYFTSYDGVGTMYLVRLNTNGTVDGTFNPGHGANNRVYACAIGTNGKIMVGGSFTGYNGSYRGRLTRLNEDGTNDPGFDAGSGASSVIRAIAVQPDQKIIIGGDLGSFNGTSRPGIARINADGSLDTGFDPGSEAASVEGIAIQPDGKVLIVGFFNSFGGVLRKHIARLDPDGGVDLSFDPGSGAITQINSIALAPDGKIVIAGTFQLYNGAVRNRVARVNADGSVDSGFTTGAGANNTVNTCAIQPDGKVMIGGVFTTYNGTSRNYIARLNTNGTLDTGFDPGTGTNGWVDACTVLPNGKILICGNFTLCNGIPRNGVARLHPDGSLDLDFNSGTGANGRVFSCVTQPDGKILIGGDLTSYNGTGRNRIARLLGTSTVPTLAASVFLAGPYTSGSMNDALRTLPSFPLTEPFTTMGYSRPVFTPGATIGPGVLSTTGDNAIVDWVIVEMRPATSPSAVAASRAVLLQRDGDIVDLDGVSSVGFSGLAPGNYCVAVLSRNHLPVMLSPSTPVAFGGGLANVDFTLPTTQVYDNDSRINVGGTMTVVAGDVNFNGTVQYTGTNNDRDLILQRIGGVVPTNSVTGYWAEDVNMDGVVRYTGTGNDRDRILQSIGGTTPTATVAAPLP